MSKENANLRLLGSPVNLSYRSKKKDDKKNIRNRPRSALQSSCITPENPERFKRPFSADTKERASTTRSFLKSFSADLLQSYNNASTNLKIVPPTTILLGDTKPYENLKAKANKETCSNASDYGSEDTFISLGTKIKTKAQTPPKKDTNTKALKYRNIAKKGRKMEQQTNDDKGNEHFGLEVTIKERAKSQSPCRDVDTFFHRCASPSFKNRAYESYFVPLDDKNKSDHNLNERQLLDSDELRLDMQKEIDAYSRRLPLTKQQLSLVEEESTQDLESIPSNNLPSLSPEASLIEKKRNTNKQDFTIHNVMTHTDKNDDYSRNQHISNESKTYRSFYEDFNNHDHAYKNNFSSTVIQTDSSSKDSGYPESVVKEDKNYVQNFSLPSATVLRKSSSDNNLHDQPKSLDSASLGSDEKNYHNTYPPDKKWAEPLNHSRLLYKDFFLKKEGHLAVPPQNSPDRPGIQQNETNYANKNLNDEKDEREISEYPKYLLNSSTKAYTSKVIEDYKREIEAINNLHELTLKDIKTDSISPTPLHIETMYEQSNNQCEDKHNSIESSQKSYETSDSPVEDKNCANNKTDISKVTTRELIQNYFKIKHDYPKGTKENVLKNLKKFEKKLNNLKTDSKSPKIDWKNKSNISRPGQETVKHQSPKNIFTTKIPLSSRIESVQNDKDVESWMSLTVPTPTTEVPKENQRTTTLEEALTENTTPRNVTPTEEVVKTRELDSKATVLDIYSMLKEIESYGDNPVTNEEIKEELPKDENRVSTPKDNFTEIFEFLEKVEQSANDALSVVTNAAPQNTPKLEVLLKLPHTELAQRVVTASLQLEERSCCIALLQESLANHKQQMITKVSNLEKQSQRNIMKVKQECEETIKRHQNFIDQLINDKKTLNHRIEQLVDERRSLEERWKRSVQTLEERYKLELRNQHDKMAAAQQVARQRWVRQKAEKIKELTVKGLEGELREMAERQQKEISDLRMSHAEQLGKTQAKHAAELELLRRNLEEEKEEALVKERQLASSRLEKQMLEIELTYQEQRTRLVSELRGESERAAQHLADREREQKEEIEKWKEEQETLLQKKREELDKEIAEEKARIEELLKQKRIELEEEFQRYKKEFEAEQQIVLKKKVTEISAQHKLERDREIEKAIESMEAEAQAGRRELQEALRRNKEQYETELKELGQTEQATLRRYQEAQARVRHTEDRCAELEVTIGQLEARNKVLTEKNIQLDSQAEEVRASCEAAWRAKLDTLTKETEDMRHKHDEQMHQLYAKVKVAVAKKDSTIQALTREAAKYQEKITLLEQKLQQQRKDFLKQK
ncbi:PREDICTED: centrosomal protein of 131 kDa isoform X2 [Papilio xuthus]|uniref:Centrosomal protein of 131 kDa isoform X2 n=1 Tax=Papilio xuthus TaxID=66420 RepID=A0AAJ6ZDF8_PAPXU|nr:PREDICTED: centrosomal protein of 131 kDa isoform X2 [Papilio xuthus]